MNSALDASDHVDLDGFDPFEAHTAELYKYLAYARQHRPVFYSAPLQAWCVTRHRDILAVQADTETFSSRQAMARPTDLPPEAEAVAQWLWSDAPAITLLDPPDHSRVRAMVKVGFMPRAMAAFEPGIRDIVERYADAVAGRDRVDLVAELAVPLPLAVVMYTIGVPDDAHQRVRDWFGDLMTIILASAWAERDELVRAAQAHQETLAYLRELIAERTAAPRNDFISFMAHNEVHGNRLSPEEIVSQIFAMLAAGTETTGHGLTNSLYALLSRPEHWAEFVAGRVPIDDVVAEGLRYDSPIVGLYRYTTREAQVAGTTIPADARVLLMFASANHDEEQFDDPATFDVHRPDVRQHSAFGHGIHYCVGAPLAKLELAIALETFARRFPNMRLLSTEPPTYQKRSLVRALRHLWVQP